MKMYEVLCTDPDIDDYIFESPTKEGADEVSFFHRHNCEYLHSCHLVAEDGDIEEIFHYDN